MSGENEPGFPRGEDIEAAGGGERLTIKVVDNNNELAFSVTRSTKLAKVISVFLSRRGGDDAATATFTFNDHPLLEDDTADSLNASNGDVVMVAWSEDPCLAGTCNCCA